MDLTALTVVLWQVCLILALVCLILLVGIILATSRWRMAIRRAVSGIGRGAVARARREAVAEVRKEAVAEVRKEAVAFKRFSSAMAGYAMHLKRGTSAVLGIPGYIMSSLRKRRERRAGILERFPSDMAKYAMHLKNHASAIHSLTKASQELKDEVSKQHRILSDLLMAIEQVPAKAEPGVEPKVKPVITREHISSPAAVSEQVPPTEEEQIAELEKGTQIPGHFRYRRQPAEEQKIAAEEAPAKKPSLATRHTLATKEAIASKALLI
jgi:hypothetical protein